MKVSRHLPSLPLWVWGAIPAGGYLVYRLWPALFPVGKGVDTVVGAVSDIGEVVGQGIKNILNLRETLALKAQTAAGEAKLAIWNIQAPKKTEKWKAAVLTARLQSLADSIAGDQRLAKEMALDYADARRVKYQARADEIARDFTDVGSDVRNFLPKGF